MLALAADSKHEIIPVKGSARQLDGQPADLARPSHFPVEGLCQACGGPVRCDRWFRGEWYHVDRFTMTGGEQ